MARKTDGTTTPRKKKIAVPAEANAVQATPEQSVAPELRSAKGSEEVHTPQVRTTEVRSAEIRSNVTPINVAPSKPAAKKSGNVNFDNVNLDEEIRRRAYELFLERKGAAGDPTADWFIAEHEVRARHAGKDSAFAARQGS